MARRTSWRLAARATPTMPFAELVSCQPQLVRARAGSQAGHDARIRGGRQLRLPPRRGKFGPFLQRHCTTRLGVRHIVDHVTRDRIRRRWRHRGARHRCARPHRRRPVRRLHRDRESCCWARTTASHCCRCSRRAVQRCRAGGAGAVRTARRADRLAHHLHRAERRLDLGHRPADRGAASATCIRARTPAMTRLPKHCAATWPPAWPVPVQRLMARGWPRL